MGRKKIVKHNKTSWSIGYTGRKGTTMKEYQFIYPHKYGEEKFYFEDGEENIVVISAENAEKAKEKLLALVSFEYEEEAKQCSAEEIDWDSYSAPHYFVKW